MRKQHAPKPLTGSSLIFFGTLDALSIPRPHREYLFHDTRDWRMDYAWPEQKIALEVEGGVFTGGRHTRGVGFMNDMEKYNAAAVMGWRIIRVVPTQLCKTETIQMLKKII